MGKVGQAACEARVAYAACIAADNDRNIKYSKWKELDQICDNAKADKNAAYNSWKIANSIYDKAYDLWFVANAACKKTE